MMYAMNFFYTAGFARGCQHHAGNAATGSPRAIVLSLPALRTYHAMMISFTIDEVVAMVQFLKRIVREVKPFWRTFRVRSAERRE